MEQWKKEYVELLFPEDSRKIDIRKAQLIKKDNTPNKLFKYRGTQSYAIENCLANQLSLSEAGKLNDPFECATSSLTNDFFFEELRTSFLVTTYDSKLFNDKDIEFLKTCTEIEFYDFIENKSKLFSKQPKGTLSKVSKTLIKEICNSTNQSLNKKNLSNLYICALSERNDSCTMWAHYAEEYKGFCVEYDFTKIIGSPVWCLLNPVIYTNQIPDFSKYFKNKEHFNNLISTYAAMIKGEEWCAEKEWRLILPIGNQPKGYFLVGAPLPSAIYLGLRISEELETKLSNYAKINKIRLYKMVEPNDSFAVAFREIKF